jgi:hypothetical protein
MTARFFILLSLSCNLREFIFEIAATTLVYNEFISMPCQILALSLLLPRLQRLYFNALSDSGPVSAPSSFATRCHCKPCLLHTAGVYFDGELLSCFCSAFSVYYYYFANFAESLMVLFALHSLSRLFHVKSFFLFASAHFHVIFHFAVLFLQFERPQLVHSYFISMPIRTAFVTGGKSISA